ncbi:MAG TPA: SRPBCC family protein [Candidatus Baltobacteraceae bacterium]|jgi:hypothetical protein
MSSATQLPSNAIGMSFPRHFYVDYDTEVVSTIFEITVKEDKILVDNVQKGINSSVYTPGLVVASEPFVAEFDRWYLHHLPGENIER